MVTTKDKRTVLLTESSGQTDTYLHLGQRAPYLAQSLKWIQM
jgi:hypothetical protein